MMKAGGSGDVMHIANNLSERPRKPHVIVDRASRELKARKIISIIGEDSFLNCRRVLEVGCGSGVISHALASARFGAVSVDAVDVIDSRTERVGYNFHLVTGSNLPFDDGAFDLVITNHVFEHVGDEQAQIAHLAEVKRVTARDGIIYFAAPNKWRLVEPHYRLPLLSWFPPLISDAYVRKARHAAYYDCFPRSRRTLERLFDATGLIHANRTVIAIRETLTLEHPDHTLTRIVNSWCPNWILRMGMPVVPTLVYLLRRKRL